MFHSHFTLVSGFASDIPKNLREKNLKIGYIFRGQMSNAQPTAFVKELEITLVLNANTFVSIHLYKSM